MRVATIAMLLLALRGHVQAGLSRRGCRLHLSCAGPRQLQQPVRFEIEKVKGSRFVGLAAPATDIASVEAVLQAEKARYPDARHWCHGARLYQPGRVAALGRNAPSEANSDVELAGRDVDERQSDDGEPSGTAGKPIVNAIRSAGAIDTVVVVTRYFGGTLAGLAAPSRPGLCD
eukprot:scaffold822_cov250-Pinguiococcus_pyrenoidosus.AAC.9